MIRDNFILERERPILSSIRAAITHMHGVEPETAHNLSITALKLTNYLDRERERAYITNYITNEEYLKWK